MSTRIGHGADGAFLDSVLEDERKECSKCKTKKEKTEFGKRKDSKTGLTSWCKKCRNKKSRKKYKENPVQKKEKNREWHKKNQEKVREKRKRYREENPEYFKKKSREDSRRFRENNPTYAEEYRSNNRERVIETERSWVEKNRKKKRSSWRKSAAKRRAIQKKTSLEDIDLDRIIEEKGLWCYLCSSDIKWENLHFDHVTPLSRGGEHKQENIFPSHNTCNKRKSHRLLNELEWFKGKDPR